MVLCVTLCYIIIMSTFMALCDTLFECYITGVFMALCDTVLFWEYLPHHYSLELLVVHVPHAGAVACKTAP